MKSSKTLFCLLILLFCMVFGGVSCSLFGGRSSSVEGGGLIGEGDELDEFDDEGFDDSEDSFDDSVESLGDSEDFFDDSVESLGDAEDSFDDSGESLDDSGESFDDSGESLADSEESFDDSGEFFDDSGESLADSEESFDDSGESFDEPEESLADSGESFDDSGESLAEESPADLEEPLEASEESFGGSGTTASITNIQFLSDQRGGAVAITTDSEVEYKTRLNAQTNQYVVDIFNVFLPEGLQRPFIMKDFKTASFGAINAYQQERSNVVSVIVQMKEGAGSPSVEQEGSVIYVIPASGNGGSFLAESSSSEEVTDDSAQAAGVEEPEGEYEEESGGEYEGESEDLAYEDSSRGREEDIGGDEALGARSLEEFLMNNNKFYGRKISLTLKDVDVVDAINFISEESGANLVLSEGIQGKVSMKLKEVPWDQVLVILLRTHKLGYVRQRNVIRISTLAELQEESNASKLIVEAQKALLPVRVRVIPVSYAKVEAMKDQLQPFLTTNRGRIAVDVRTSSVIITDVVEVLDRMSVLIKRLDVPPEQVMIEGKVVEATKEFSKRLGITWGLSGTSTSLGGGGSALAITPSLGVRPVSSSSILGSISFMNLNVGTIDFLGDLDAALELAESDSTARVISSPRIVTMNKQSSKISQSGEVISISAISNQGVTSRQVNRTPVTLSLSVTPQITSAGGVIMEVDFQRQFPGAIEDTETLARAVNSRSAQTKVLVHNGQTAVIGGIYNTRETIGESGVPNMKDIPFVGWLFKHQIRENRKNELLIFLTPRILKQKR